MPVDVGEVAATAYTTNYDEREYIAFRFGDIGDGEDVLVRVHRECLLGDVFESLCCRCAERLRDASGRPWPLAPHPSTRGRPTAGGVGADVDHNRELPRERLSHDDI